MTQAMDAVWLPVLPSMKGFGPALVKGAGAEADKAGGSVGKKFGAALAVGATAAVGAVAAAGGALYKVGAVFDDVTDTIRTQTGKSGAALDGLVASAKNVGATVPVEFEKIGPVVAGLNQRLGLSGETLEKVSSQYLEAGRILGEEVDIDSTTAAFSAFGIEGAAVEGAMDSLFRVAQSTGIGMNQLAGIVQTSAPAMQNLGFSFEETAALAGTLDKAGLNTQQVMASMSKGLVTLAKDGEKPQEAFRRTVGEIQGFIAAGDTAGAIDLASKVFGTKGATQFIGALQSGKVNLDELAAAAVGTGDTILGVGKETADFAEQWQLFKNRVLVWLEPLGSRVFGAMGTAMAEVNAAVTAFGAAWKANDGDITSSGLPGFFEKLAFIAHNVFDQIATAAAPFVTLFSNVFSSLAPMFAPLLPMLVQVVTAFSPLGLMLKALTPVLPQIAGLVQTLGAALSGALASILPTITELIGSLVGTLSGVFIQIMPTIVSLVGMLGEVFAVLAPVIGQILAKVAPLISSFVSMLAPILVDLVQTIIPPLVEALMGIVSAILPIVDVILAVLVPAIQFMMPIWQFVFTVIAEVVKVAIGIVTGIIQGVVWFIRDVLAPVVMWLWQNIIEPAFNAIGAVVKWVWETILKPTFDAWVWLFQNVIGPAFNWLWETIIKPVFDGIGAAMKWLWETILKPTFDAWVWIFQNILGPAFSWLYENVIKPVFDGIGAAIKWVWENVIKPVFDTLTKVIQEDIPKGFEQGKKFIEDIWKGIQDVVKAPIKFVVQTVLNDGLIKAFNTVADFLKIGKLPPIDLGPGWRDGGYTGNLPRGAVAGVVHGDEHVIRSESRRRMEREVPGLLDHINHYGTLFGYAGGGRVAPLKELLVTQGYNRVHKGIDYAAAVGTPVFATQDGVVTHAGPGARAPGVWGGEEVHILGNGIETWFAHLSRIGVKLGDMVTAGQMIARSGNTGISSGPHLHFGVFSGGWPNDMDPAAYLGGAGAPSGAGFNPITAIIDALVTKFKEAFPGGGAFIDLVGGVGKSILIGAADFITGLFSDSQDKKGNTVGVDPALYDLGGVLPPGVSQVVNRTSKPEAILNAQQWADIHRLAAREASRDRPGVSIGTVHVRDENEMVRLIRNSERDAQAVYGF